MSHQFYSKMTEAQKTVINKLTLRAEEQLLAAIADAREAKEAIIKLPALNESGDPVVHGCNYAMQKVAEHYKEIVQAWYLRLCMIDNDKAQKIWLANLDVWRI